MLAFRRPVGLGQVGLRALRTPSTLRASTALFNGALHARHASTEPTTQEAAVKILVDQRKNRPLSPDLQIYQPQLTAIMSGLHRITGVALAGGFYCFLIGYVAGPMVGLNFDSSTIINAFAALPLVAKIPLKFMAALPLTYHMANGVRHLIWDTTKELTLKGVYRTGYFVTGFSLLSSLVLCFM